ncbi:hypothetical protein [Kocuria sp. cx-455]|uniref:hypothetical protein n=1 Tax=Kocuria sp. cx-455 TaxID=2771377 RepID=UPI001CC24E7A|nr:hypothetical protein [Kocuria sp. cx-455]
MPETTTSQTTSRNTCAVVNPATGELVEEAEGAYGPLSSRTAAEGAEMPFGGVKRSGFGRELGPRTGPRDQLRQALRSQHAGRVRAGGREVRRPLPRQGVAPAHQHQVARVPAREAPHVRGDSPHRPGLVREEREPRVVAHVDHHHPARRQQRGGLLVEGHLREVGGASRGR